MKAINEAIDNAISPYEHGAITLPEQPARRDFSRESAKNLVRRFLQGIPDDMTVMEILEEL